mmetsp:Transcript_34712/g.69126  ORF Transcript_34712/g.69126 Transcript_34712/m.69126 type:complete len:125 (-) Transcript_34712:53-427(-)
MGDFLTHTHREPAHVCVTHFVLDCLGDLPAAVGAVRESLAPGGAWIFAGPLHYFQGGPYTPKPAPPLTHLLELAEDCGLQVDASCRRRIARIAELHHAPYVERPGAFLHEANWRVPCFVARRKV